jgi:hypothetical protein
MHVGIRTADHHRIVYRCRSADYVQRYWHHSIDTLAAVAVRCKIAYYLIDAVRFYSKEVKIGSGYISQGFALKIELFFRFTVKGTILKRQCILLQYVVAVRGTVQRTATKFPKIRETVTSRVPCL